MLNNSLMSAEEFGEALKEAAAKLGVTCQELTDSMRLVGEVAAKALEPLRDLARALYAIKPRPRWPLSGIRRIAEKAGDEGVVGWIDDLVYRYAWLQQ